MTDPRLANEEEEEDFSEVNCTFGFFDPVPSDAMTISAFMPRYVPINRLEIARAIACQNRVGTTIKEQIENGMPGDNFFGFNSVLNLGAYKDVLSSIDPFIKWLIGLGNPALTQVLSQNLNTTGWIINERARGVPDGLAPHLMRGLWKEIQWATEDLDTQEDRDSFKFTHYIMIKKVAMTEDGFVFPNIEDEFFYKEATVKIEFETGGEDGDLDGVDYHHMVLLFDPQVFINVRQQLNQTFMIDESIYENENN